MLVGGDDVRSSATSIAHSSVPHSPMQVCGLRLEIEIKDDEISFNLFLTLFILSRYTG